MAEFSDVSQPIREQPHESSGSNVGLMGEHLAKFFTSLDHLTVQESMRLRDVYSSYDKNLNKYQVMNSAGDRLFRVVATSTYCQRLCCGSYSPVTLSICTDIGVEVLHLERPFRCKACYCPCCLQEMTVSAPRGPVIGRIQQDWHPYLAMFSILDDADNVVFKAQGPACICPCDKVEFKVLGNDGVTEVASITKREDKITRACFADTDSFDITFPVDMDARVKATLLGFAFLVDFMYFDRSTINCCTGCLIACSTRGY